MKAKDILDKYTNPDFRDKLCIIAISDTLGYWFHVHEDEDVPENDDQDFFTIAIAAINDLKNKNEF